MKVLWRVKKMLHILYQNQFCYDKNEKKKFKLYNKVIDHFIIQENLEELLITFTISIINYHKEFLYYIIMVQHMIITF